MLNPGPILEQNYPRVHRIALAICGDRRAGKAVIDQVLRQSGVIVARWEGPAEADRWFLRYTVLCSREHSPTDSANDPLFAAATGGDAQALVVALRNLPRQQVEAFLLNHGEKLDARSLATAMDCSSSAAANHLKAAEDSLQSIAVGGLSGFITVLPAMMQQLAPAPGTVAVEIKQVIRKRRRRILLRRWVWMPLKWMLLAAAGWAGWKIWRAL